MPGRIAMYTSGWPKNQNRCCQRSGEPPVWGMILSLTMRPPGTKKLVPPTRSRSSSAPAASKTAKESRERMAVMNQLQQVSGSRRSESPRARRSSVVAMKLSAPSIEATQKMAMEMIHRVWPAACPGPAAPPTALSGG